MKKKTTHKHHNLFNKLLFTNKSIDFSESIILYYILNRKHTVFLHYNRYKIKI